MKFITPSIHGILDYLVDIFLIFIPIVFDFGNYSSPVVYIPLSIGITNLLYSFLTIYSRSLVKLIPFKVHLVMDYLAGISLIATPFLIENLEFSGLFILAMGIGIFVATFFTKTSESR